MVLPRSLIGMAAAIGLMLCAVAVAAGLLGSTSSSPAARLIEMHPAQRPYSLKDLAGAADLVAVIEPTGSSAVHWNSGDSQEWTAQPEDARQPLIYRDDDVRVIRVLAGNRPEDVLTVRGVGGTVGGVTLTYDGQTDWAAGQRYLVFLRRDQTPTRDGFEEMWTEVDIGQSAFTLAADGRWINGARLLLAEGDVPVAP